MVRLYFYVEGQTEQEFCGRILREHLASFGVFVQGAILAATKRRHASVWRGGGRHYLPWKNDLIRLLKQDQSFEARFTTMFDFYHLPVDFPGKSKMSLTDPYLKTACLEQAFAADLSDRRLIPYLQLHEFETLLFADAQTFGEYFHNATRQVERLESAVRDCPEIERINEGQHTHPAARLTEIFPDFEKRTAGIFLAEYIGLPTIRAKCPHFNEWLTRLEQLTTTSV
jgi:Domain of unknown function (DUF4276)